MEINQVLVSASQGDAVTNAAFEIRSLLRRFGRSEIYARYFEPALTREVHPLSDYAKRRSANPERDVICYHASIGQPEVTSFLLDRSERLAVVYHNISPGAPFRGYDSRFADALDKGRRELSELRPRTRLALAPSAYNATELEAMGFGDVRIAPLVVDPARLHCIEPHWPTANHLATEVHGPVALFVGQLLPHKRPDLLLEAFHLLATYLVPESQLVLVGAGRLGAYRRALQLFAHELNLSNTWFAGRVTDAELAAFYRRADVFVTASEHEGVCVPIIEAMSFDVPVVARAYAAVPETVGDGGLVLPPDDDPMLLAEALATVITDREVHEGLVRRGRRRLSAFDPEEARAVFVRHILDAA